MKILICHDNYASYVGGSVLFTRRLVKGLKDQGHELLVVGPSSSRKLIYSSVDGVPFVGIPSLPYFGTKGYRVSFPSRGNKRRIKALLLEFKPEVIHIQGHVFLPKAMMEVSQELQIPVVATSHFMVENILYYSPVPPVPLVRRAIAWWTYGRRHKIFKNAVQLTSPTRTAAELLQETSRLDRPVKAISCGVDLSIFKPDLSTVEVRNRYELPEGLFALYVGRLEKEKHLEELIYAMAELKEDLVLVLAGKGGYADQLKKLTQELHLEERVRFLGFVPDEDLPALYASADFFIIPSRAELQSIVTMEAMACGLPVIAANAVALPELVSPGENGFLFEPGNFTDLARAMSLLARDSELRKRMAASSLKKIASHDLSHTISAFEEVYEQASRATPPLATPPSRLPFYLCASFSALFLGVGVISFYFETNGYVWLLRILYHALANNPGSHFILLLLQLLKDLTVDMLQWVASFSFGVSFLLFVIALFWFDRSFKKPSYARGHF